MALKLKQKHEAKMKATNSITKAEVIDPKNDINENTKIIENPSNKDLEIINVKNENQIIKKKKDDYLAKQLSRNKNGTEINDTKIETIGFGKFANEIKRTIFIKEKSKTNPLLSDKLLIQGNRVDLNLKNNAGTTLSKINSTEETKNDHNLFQMTKKKFELSKTKLDDLKLKVKEIRSKFDNINRTKFQISSESKGE